MTGAAGTNHVQLWKSFPEHVQSHAQIVKELNQRDEHHKIQDRETVKRSLQSGEPNDEVDVELFSKKARLFYALSFVHQTFSNPDDFLIRCTRFSQTGGPFSTFPL